MLDLKKYKKILVFLAHPDDETLAAGGTINKLTDIGSNVHIALPSSGIQTARRKSLKKESEIKIDQLHKDCKNALNILGVDLNNCYLGDFPDNEMDKRSLLELIHWLEKIIFKVKPDLIITHHRYCTNIDHQYCHNAAIVASRPSIDQHITVISAEIPSVTGYLKPVNWEPNLYIELSEKNLNNKLEAMSLYKGEIRKDPHPRSKEVIKALAKLRGSESGFYYAESFMIQKIFA